MTSDWICTGGDEPSQRPPCGDSRHRWHDGDTHRMFLLGTLYNALLDGVLGDESVHGHLPRLPKTMCTVHCLPQSRWKQQTANSKQQILAAHEHAATGCCDIQQRTK